MSLPFLSRQLALTCYLRLRESISHAYGHVLTTTIANSQTLLTIFQALLADYVSISTLISHCQQLHLRLLSFINITANISLEIIAL